MPNRRTFLQSAASLPFLIQTAKSQAASSDPLLQAKKEPVLKLDSFNSPIIIDSIELFRANNEFFVKTTSKDGAVGVSITNNRASYLYPILDRLVIPHFKGKDARDLESLVDKAYLFKNNYKIAGLALWCPVAWVEMSILDMLGQIAKKPVGELFGGIIRREIPIYCASGNRHTSPQDEAKILANLVEKTGAKAVKFKVGGRMSKDRDSIPGRSEALIPLARQTLGDDIAIHVDSNGSYGVKKAIEIGKMLEDINAVFFEEPCEFDHLEETKQVADALKIPVAGGECENSFWRFRWLLRNNAVQVIQPDLHYNGGFIRAKQAANMAQTKGIPITLHMGGSGVGFVEVLQFCSFTPNVGPYQEYKGGIHRIGPWYDPPLRLKNGKINIPQAPGLGLTADHDVFQNAKKII